MFSTTYPCHECARLIIASGIKRVVYIDPYPKSQVPDMYEHEIVEGSLAQLHPVVSFVPFEGIAPRLYANVFSASNRGRDEVTGDFKRWNPAQAPPRLVAEAEALPSIYGMEASTVAELSEALEAAGWRGVRAP
jgi:cytidine deaminase